MSHHSQDDPPQGLTETFLPTKAFRGALGEFPEGKLMPSDEGAIQFAIGERDGKVILDFGTPVTWLGLTPADACKLAEHLIKQARQAAKESGGVLTVNL